MTYCIALKKTPAQKNSAHRPIRSRAIVEHVVPRWCTRMNHDDQWWPYYRLNKQKIRALQLRRVFLDGFCLAWRSIHALQSSRKHHYWLPKPCTCLGKTKLWPHCFPCRNRIEAVKQQKVQHLRFAILICSHWLLPFPPWHIMTICCNLGCQCTTNAGSVDMSLWFCRKILEVSLEQAFPQLLPAQGRKGQAGPDRKATKSFHNKQEFFQIALYTLCK